ncbi:Electron transfer DM13 [Streptomyces sp. YIM 121038]|uniref:DM13 domain-containing protein n=1 Tax=Streptomyces sp. YIM 121038 TaxID=2136401 RepID=UPI0011100697|nr:DM13 domain-containing protein [Streptomyces sp. YIM 121038]QCX74433.1 Electron transfer DM13 [Streptomyces sp. YIM 121038]
MNLSPRRRVVVPALLVTTLVAAFALYFFQPWRAFTNTTVNESLPTATAGGGEDAGGGSAPAAVRELARGSLVAHEHPTSGTARTLRLADGRQLLRLEDLKTSEGPDVRVYLSTRPASKAADGLGAGAVWLGRLKGNLGNQNYTVPDGSDPAGFRSAVVWCERFGVSFGAADLTPSPAAPR